MHNVLRIMDRQLTQIVLGALNCKDKLNKKTFPPQKNSLIISMQDNHYESAKFSNVTCIQSFISMAKQARIILRIITQARFCSAFPFSSYPLLLKFFFQWNQAAFLSQHTAVPP